MTPGEHLLPCVVPLFTSELWRPTLTTGSNITAARSLSAAATVAAANGRARDSEHSTNGSLRSSKGA